MVPLLDDFESGIFPSVIRFVWQMNWPPRSSRGTWLKGCYSVEHFVSWCFFGLKHCRIFILFCSVLMNWPPRSSRVTWLKGCYPVEHIVSWCFFGYKHSIRYQCTVAGWIFVKSSFWLSEYIDIFPSQLLMYFLSSRFTLRESFTKANFGQKHLPWLSVISGQCEVYHSTWPAESHCFDSVFSRHCVVSTHKGCERFFCGISWLV